MAKPLSFGRDINSYNAYAPATADIKWSANLTNSTATSVTLPSTSDNWIVAFSIQPGTDVWVDLTGATASLPVGASLDSTTADLNPGQRLVKGGSLISVITGSANAEICIMAWPVLNG